MSYLHIALGRLQGEKYIDVCVGPYPEEEVLLPDGEHVFDERGVPVYADTYRKYLDEIPGGPTWPPERIEAAKAWLISVLPEDWELEDFITGSDYEFSPTLRRRINK